MEENGKAFKNVAAAKGGESAVSARKLAATRWEIDGGLHSPAQDKDSEVEIIRKQRILESSRLGSTALVLSDLISKKMDQPKVGAHRRRASACSQKLVNGDCNSASGKSPHNYMIEVDPIGNHARSPCRTKNRLKDVYNGLVTSKELLKVMTRVCRLDERSSTSLSLFSALKFELDRACASVGKLIQEERTKSGEVDFVLKQLEEERMVWKLKEQERIRRAISSVSGEVEAERKLRKQAERLNKSLGRELAETKASLSSEKRAREILEQVCDELAQGMGDGRAEAEAMMRQSEKVCEEVEKEREMLQLADVLREERVQMKLAEAKFEFEEKNEVVDKLRDELEAYLKTKKGEEKGGVSPSYDKIKELEKYLRRTLPSSYVHEDGGENSGDSDLESIELDMDELSKRGLFEFSSKALKKDVEKDEIERYNMIKDLRDRIVSNSRIVSSQQSDPTNGVACEG